MRATSFEGYPLNLKMSELSKEELDRVLESSSKFNRNIGLSFLGYCIFLFFATAGVRDVDLLFADGKVDLPLIGIDLPIIPFFIAAPLILVVFHVNLLYHLNAHTDRLCKWIDIYMGSDYKLLSDKKWQKQMRSRFPNFFYNSVVFTDAYSKIIFKYLFFEVPVIAFPILLLSYIEFRFADYHSLLVTFAHFVLVMIDVLFSIHYGGKILRAVRETQGRTKRLKRLLFVSSLASGLSFGLVNASMFVLVGLIHFGALDGLYSYSDKTLKESPFLIYSQLRVKFGEVIPHLRVRGSDFSMREKSPVIIEDRDLRFADFTEVDFSDYTFVRSKLQGSRFSLCEFDSTKWIHSDLSGGAMLSCNAKMIRANGTNFKKGVFYGTSFSNSFFEESSFEKSALEWASFSNTHINNTSFHQARLRSCTIDGGTFFSSKKMEVNVTGSPNNFHGSVFEDCEIDSCRLGGFSLKGGRVIGGVWNDMSFDQLELIGTLVEGVFFDSVKFISPNFEYNYFSNVGFSECSFSIMSDSKIRNNIFMETAIARSSISFPFSTIFEKADGNDLNIVSNFSSHTMVFDSLRINPYMRYVMIRDGGSSIKTNLEDSYLRDGYDNWGRLWASTVDCKTWQARLLKYVKTLAPEYKTDQIIMRNLLIVLDPDREETINCDSGIDDGALYNQVVNSWNTNGRIQSDELISTDLWHEIYAH